MVCRFQIGWRCHCFLRSVQIYRLCQLLVTVFAHKYCRPLSTQVMVPCAKGNLHHHSKPLPHYRHCLLSNWALILYAGGNVSVDQPGWGLTDHSIRLMLHCCCLGYTSGNVFQTIAQEYSAQYVDLQFCGVSPYWGPSWHFTVEQGPFRPNLMSVSRCAVTPYDRIHWSKVERYLTSLALK